MNRPLPVPAPLGGIRILALEHWAAMPAATNILAGLGAQVIKIEEPRRGDEGRRSTPVLAFELADGADSAGDAGSMFMRYNRGKASLAVDLARSEGVELVKRLVPAVDVFAENLRAGVADRLGLGEPELRAINPSLIYASISGFGLSGGSPYQHLPSFAPAAEAMAAMPQLAQTPDGTPRAGSFGAIVDLAAGMNAAIGILAALHGRDRNHGHGYQVDIALLDTAIALNDMAVQFAALGESADKAVAGKVGIIELFRASDGLFVVVAVRPEHLAKLGHAVGQPSWGEDPKLADRSRWHEQVESTFRPAIESWARNLTAFDAAEQLCAAGVVAAPNFDADQLIDDPHVKARGLLTPVSGLERDAVVVGSPVTIVGHVDERDRLPRIGEDTVRILTGELGLTDAQVQELVRRELIRVPRNRSATVN